jgi:ribonuclease P protein component
VRVARSSLLAVARAASGSPPDPAFPVLPAGSRLTHRDEFASVLRRGRRSGRSRLVVHLQCPAERSSGVRPARAGLVVSKAVGGSVVRHRVSRKLRHLLAPRLGTLPDGALVVVRALPPAATATSAELAEDLDAGLHGALRKVRGADRG